ncbi:MAG: hypothetical protein ACOYBW_08730 [Fluviibacter phosphoraccumulans]
MDHQTQTETASVIVAKVAPPASVSLAHMLGMPVSDLILWATLFYTLLLIIHKVIVMYRDLSKPAICVVPTEHD